MHCSSGDKSREANEYIIQVVLNAVKPYTTDMRIENGGDGAYSR